MHNYLFTKPTHPHTDVVHIDSNAFVITLLALVTTIGHMETNKLSHSRSHLVRICMFWAAEEARELIENPNKDRENMQTSHRKESYRAAARKYIAA